MVPAARLGRYEVLAKLAAGGMGEIFLARLHGAAGFEKLFVIKKILPHLASDARFRQMMIAEAQIAAKMSHANVSTVYELDEIDGTLYIAMEYLEGITALALLRKAARKKQPLDLGLIGGVLTQVCDGLHYAHELKDRDGVHLAVVHRDVTPSNVLITEQGVAKLLDFGIAKVENVANTESGAIKGKYAYMAPEQLRGQDIDRRVDIFACGILMFELLALRRLFQRKTDYLTFQAVLDEPLRDVRQYRPDAPDAVVALVARCLAPDPKDRYDTARQLRTALVAAIGTPVWGPNDIADYVHSNFDEDVRKRRSSVQSATRRDGAATMPLIWSSGSSDPDEDDEYFVGPSRSMNAVRAVADAAFGDRGDHTSPDITAQTKVDSPRRPTGRPAMPSAPSRRRGLVLGGLGLVVAAAVAAFVVISTTRSSPSEPTPPSDPYSRALFDGRAGLERCAHLSEGKLAAYTRASVIVEPDGRVADVTLEPAAGNNAVARCVRDALRGLKFPAAATRSQVVIALTEK